MTEPVRNIRTVVIKSFVCTMISRMSLQIAAGMEERRCVTCFRLVQTCSSQFYARQQWHEWWLSCRNANQSFTYVSAAFHQDHVPRTIYNDVHFIQNNYDVCALNLDDFTRRFRGADGLPWCSPSQTLITGELFSIFYSIISTEMQ